MVTLPQNDELHAKIGQRETHHHGRDNSSNKDARNGPKPLARDNYAQVEISKHPIWRLSLWKTFYPIWEVWGHGGVLL
jgi:hypothetical protein